MKETIKKIIRSITIAKPFEPLLVRLSQGHGSRSPFVIMLPRHTQYNKNDIRSVTRNGINYELTLDNYNDFLVYYGIDNQNKNEIYDLVQEDFHVMDVGTNIGEVLLNIAKRAKRGEVHGFEPVPYNYNKAAKNISLNSFDNIILNPIALSDRDENLYFDESEVAGHSGSVYMNKTNELNSKEVSAMTLDRYVEENRISKVDFIKVDIEGFEMNFLKGAKQTLIRFRPVLYMEVDDKYLKRQKSSAAEMIAWLEELGIYQIRDIAGNPVKSSDDFEGRHFDVVCRPLLIE